MNNNTWDVTVDGVNYHIERVKTKISINGGEFKKLTKFKRKMHLLEYEYQIPLGNKIAVLHIPGGTGRENFLTIDNIDCITGEEYERATIPVWSFIFVALYIFNVLFIIGGAIGGALAGGFGCLSVAIASDKKKSLAIRIMLCIGTYVLVTTVSILLAYFLTSLLYPNGTYRYSYRR